MEDQQQDNSGMMGGGSYNNPMNSNNGSIIEITDTESLFLMLEANLRGVVLNNVGEEIYRGDALLNEKGILNIMMMIRAAGNRASVMSHFEESKIRIIMEYLNDTICRTLMMNMVNYEIVNPSARDMILFSCNSCILAIVMRGFEGGERKFWKGSQIDYNVNNRSGEKKSIFGNMFKK